MPSRTVLVAVEVPDNVSPEQVRTLVERAALHRWGLYADEKGRPRVAVWETDGEEVMEEAGEYLRGVAFAAEAKAERERRLTVVPDGDEGGEDG